MADEVLFVHEERKIYETFSEFLTQQGFKTQYMDQLNAAFQCLNSNIKVVIVSSKQADWDKHLFKLKKYQALVLVLSDKAQDAEIIHALSMGADDCLLSIVSQEELLARLNAMLRRKQDQRLQFGKIQLDLDNKLAFLQQKAIDLTLSEFNILRILIQEPGHAFSKTQLTELALAREFTAYDRSIDVHISHLRSKLGSALIIKTIRGYGYILTPL